MFRKFLVSLLILPSCLGFDLAAASLKNEVQTLPKSFELGLPTQKTQANQNAVNFSPFPVKEHSSIQGDQEANTEEVKQIKYEHPYQIAHEYYYHHRACSHYRYYHHRYYHPDYVDYRYHYHHEYYYSRYYHPDYVDYRYHYYHEYYYPRYYHNNGYYGNGYDYSNYHYRYNHNNGYYRHGDYYPRYYHQRYYRHGYDY